jgi:preprotein translocase subunit SecY
MGNQTTSVLALAFSEIIQLIVGTLIVILFDELLQKGYGLGYQLVYYH